MSGVNLQVLVGDRQRLSHSICKSWTSISGNIPYLITKGHCRDACISSQFISVDPVHSQVPIFERERMRTGAKETEVMQRRSSEERQAPVIQMQKQRRMLPLKPKRASRRPGSSGTFNFAQ